MKPTYEELELQLEESQREFRAADATIHNLELKLTDMAVQLANAESKCRELTAESAGLKSNLMYWNGEDTAPAKSPLDIAYESSFGEGVEFDVHVAARMPSMTYRVVRRTTYSTEIELVRGGIPETPATDAFLAEVQASARNEGINYAASRLAAAFNHGFVDKPLAEVCDVVRMILDTKEELANSTLPAADGISGEYAEKFLAEFAAQIRKGAEL
ncbi:hypothetical protein SFC19_01655 [Citrobacter portucalensis]